MFRRLNTLVKPVAQAQKSIASVPKRAFASKPNTPKEAVAYIKSSGAEIADFRFTDLHGTEQHIQFPVAQIDEGFFATGVAFDGSSIRGWQPINLSDMLLLPETSTAFIDPFSKHKTVNFTCNVVDPISKDPYSRDPRSVSKKSIEYLRSTGLAHDCNIGPENEFFVFDKISYDINPLSSNFAIYSNESYTTSGTPFDSNYKLRKKEGYFPVKPWDQHVDMRNEMMIEMEKLGLQVERGHHEVASPGQGEINFRFDNLVSAADKVQLYKYVVRNVAARYGRIATFMPKPVSDENGTGMHTHVSLHLKDGTNLFTGKEYAGLSQMSLYFIGGIIKHSKALLAITNPTVNSYKRLVPGFEAPVNMAYSARNRSASIRIPISHPKARRLEFRTPDGAANPYLAFSAILMAGLDGIQNKVNPGPALEKDIYSLSEEELSKIPKAPNDLPDAIEHLEKDHEFLTRGNVFTKDLLEMWVARKKEAEIDPYRKLITPFEFHAYFDC